MQVQDTGAPASSQGHYRTPACQLVVKDKQVQDTGAPASSQGQASRVVLPPIQLPNFSGHPRDWMNFSNLFTVLVVDCKHLTSSLDDESASLIQSLILIDTNYETAWDVLVRRYNKRLVMTCHIDAVLLALDVVLLALDVGTSEHAIVRTEGAFYHRRKCGCAARVRVTSATVGFILGRKFDTNLRQP
ncbi:hypothetical protein PR048_009382 [Dryococelus australis]|uniref:Uncharacterized protein n=1 Tax=Dryococelus australis TaxID=614101 RepID=A0ABQ9HZQ5_9NEOP|nr:hypothetical protein PR048_009382 [Dryococelus australis]